MISLSGFEPYSETIRFLLVFLWGVWGEGGCGRGLDMILAKRPIGRALDGQSTKLNQLGGLVFSLKL
jgi:hypothetical protein